MLYYLSFHIIPCSDIQPYYQDVKKELTGYYQVSKKDKWGVYFKPDTSYAWKRHYTVWDNHTIKLYEVDTLDCPFRHPPPHRCRYYKSMYDHTFHTMPTATIYFNVKVYEVKCTSKDKLNVALVMRR